MFTNGTTNNVLTVSSEPYFNKEDPHTANKTYKTTYI